MSELTRVDLDALREAKAKLRTLTKQAEADQSGRDLVHPAYKVGQFLAEALPGAWPLAERVPDSPPENGGQE